MSENRQSNRKMIQLLFAILIWLGIGNAGFNFAIGDVPGGVTWSIIALVLLILIVDDRVIKRIYSRPTPKLSLIFMGFVAIVVVIGAISDLLIMDVSLFESIYLPGMITAIEAIGSFILSGLFIVELVKLAKQ